MIAAKPATSAPWRNPRRRATTEMGDGESVRVVKVGIMLAVLALGGCVAKPAAKPPAPPMSSWKRIEPACKLDGCCQGHGDVAFVQPDRFIMCTDGETSRICDCH